MLKKILPALAIVFSVLLDTAVLPVFLYGRYLIPVSLILVILIGIQLGRMNGMLYGMIAGLLLDISTGTLGLKLANSGTGTKLPLISVEGTLESSAIFAARSLLSPDMSSYPPDNLRTHTGCNIPSCLMDSESSRSASLSNILLG